MAIEIGIFHNGASDLKAVTTPNGVVVNDGSLEEVHRSYQRVLVGQVRQGILADRLGYDYWFMTEHHFMPEGPEFSPSPLLTEAAIASRTKRIRFGQMANILPWWHPLRLPAARGRDLGLALRIDHPGPGTQPLLLRGGLRDHHEGLDGAVLLPP